MLKKNLIIGLINNLKDLLSKCVTPRPDKEDCCQTWVSMGCITGLYDKRREPTSESCP